VERGVLGAELGDQAIWLQMSTIGERATERCIELARDHSLEFVDASRSPRGWGSTPTGT
jgi:3-hydroxyisobutyrate dehydrogenase-like beta-hydroxyacid dehydrogenase